MSDWIPTTERLPEVCQPVIGYADKWVHPDFNEMGMRECFRNDDEWQSAAWNNYQDCWDVETGPPDYWMPFPDAPSVESGPKSDSASVQSENSASASASAPPAPLPSLFREEGLND